MAGGGSAENSAESRPSWHKAVGIALALSSALFIGISFIVKKKGLIDSNSLQVQNRQRKNEQDQKVDNHAYLKNKLWWTGMILSKLQCCFSH
jgi:hypothetical protein